MPYTDKNRIIGRVHLSKTAQIAMARATYPRALTVIEGDYITFIKHSAERKEGLMTRLRREANEVNRRVDVQSGERTKKRHR